MMTAVMMKADTRPASRGSSVGESCCIVAGTQTQEEIFSLEHTVAQTNRPCSQDVKSKTSFCYANVLLNVSLVLNQCAKITFITFFDLPSRKM